MNDEKLVERVRGEFTEMPDLRLAPDQAARLWAIDVHASVRVLEVLVDDGFLHKTADGAYLRVGVTG